MREINVSEIISTVERLCIESNIKLPGDVRHALDEALKKESSPLGQEILKDIIKNAKIAEEKNIPI